MTTPTPDPLEQRLRQEPLLPVPPDLAARVILGLPPRRQAFDPRVLLRFAAAVLATFGAWVLATGAVPSAASAAPAPWLEQAIGGARDALPSRLDAGLLPLASGSASTGMPPGLLAGIGALLLVAGLLLARRLLGGGARRRTP